MKKADSHGPPVGRQALSEDSGTVPVPSQLKEQAWGGAVRWGGRVTGSDQKNRFSSGTDERLEAHGTMWQYAS